MFIQTEETPNPETLKFIPGQTVLEKGTLHVTNQEDAKLSPLTEKLFEIESVRAVFLGKDFISVTKNPEYEWATIKAKILATIMQHFVTEQSVMSDKAKKGKAKPKEEFDKKDKELVKQIKELLDTRVRPAVAQDGGDIIFRGYKKGVVMLELHGACAGCPSSTVTLKHGIENMLKHYVPEIESVEAVPE